MDNEQIKQYYRFSDRVQDYVQYRPHYPNGIIDFLENEYSINNRKTIADIGSGTGISSELFLKRGYNVIGIEPNQEMRKASKEYLKNYDGFSDGSGTAEATLLPHKSVDIIVAAQAFHWFEVGAVKEEFKRILKPDGLVVLIWNERLTVTTFEKELDQLIISHAIEYVKVNHRNIDLANIQKFFSPHLVQLKEFSNYQNFDFEGLKGRLLSSSYMPQTNDQKYTDMVTELKSLFERHKLDDNIQMNYNTKVYISHL